MSYANMAAVITAIVGLIAIITPIVKLNTNIVKLTVVVEQLETLVHEKTEELARRVTEHGKEIDNIRITEENHETRLKQLEKK